MSVLSFSETDLPVLVSNVEVLHVIEKQALERSTTTTSVVRKTRRFRHRDWVEQQVTNYLRSTFPVKIDRDRYQELRQQLCRGPKQMESVKRRKIHQNGDYNNNNENKARMGFNETNNIRESLAKATTTTTTIPGFDLTEAEAIQIINFMPTEPVEIHLMIEELDARIPEKRQDELLELISSYRNTEKAAFATLETTACSNSAETMVQQSQKDRASGKTEFWLHATAIDKHNDAASDLGLLPLVKQEHE